MVEVEERELALKTQMYWVHRKLVVFQKNSIYLKKTIWVLV
jgi:hypothetical protein